MPKIRSSRSRPPPEGFDEIETELELLQEKMREAESESTEGKPRFETLWSVIRVNHQRSRYVFNLFNKEKSISRELYEYLVKQGYADGALMVKWRKSGFDSLCCLQCATGEHAKGGACLCRVPEKDRKSKVDDFQCKTCGCTGCASGI